MPEQRALARANAGSTPPSPDSLRPTSLVARPRSSIGEHCRRRHEERVRARRPHDVESGAAQQIGEVAPAEPARGVGHSIVTATQPPHARLHQRHGTAWFRDARHLTHRRRRIGVHPVAQRGDAQHGVEDIVGMRQRVQVGDDRPVPGTRPRSARCPRRRRRRASAPGAASHRPVAPEPPAASR